MSAAVALAAALLAGTGLQAADPDATHAAWRYRRSVAAPRGSTFGALPLPPEIAGECLAGLADLRLVDAQGHDVAYVLDRQEDRAAATVALGRLARSTRERRVSSTWDVDLGAPRTFDRVWLEAPERDFTKTVRVFVSDDGGSWRAVRDDAAVFDRQWNVRVHHTTVDLDAPVTARWLRLILDDRRSAPLALTGVAAWRVRPVPGSRWSRPLALVPTDPAERGTTRYRVDAGGLPLEQLELQADDPAFARHVRLIEERQRGGPRQRVVLGEGPLYRLALADLDLAVDARVLPVAQSRGGELFLEVEGGDSPPLRGPVATGHGQASRIVFAADGPLTLYSGNAQAQAPAYDVARLAQRLGLAGDLGEATIGERVANPQFRAEPVLPFVAVKGAVLESRLWAWQRAVTVPAEGLHALTLGPGDLARLQPGAPDLRLADATDAQVPYVLERDAQDAEVTLAVAAVAPLLARTSRHALRPAAEPGQPAPRVAWHALELEVDDPYFSRHARVVAPASASRGEDRVLFSGELSRLPGAPATLRVPLSGEPAGELVLEVENGDDAAITVRGGRALLKVPRITFRAGAGPHRLLLGNPAAPAPQYDVVRLRGLVLAAEAAPLLAGPLEPNPGQRRGPLELLRQTPAEAVMWGTLVLAMALLLWLTARLAGRANTPAPPPAPDDGARPPSGE